MRIKVGQFVVKRQPKIETNYILILFLAECRRETWCIIDLVLAGELNNDGVEPLRSPPPAMAALRSPPPAMAALQPPPPAMAACSPQVR